MNERILELIQQMNRDVGIQWINEDKLKFAELIVRECAGVGYDASYFECASNVSNKILKHFGLE
jgi:hypothetical protein